MISYLVQAQSGPAAITIRDALNDVFTGEAYDRTVTHTVWTALMGYIGKAFTDFMRLMRDTPPLRYAFLALAGVLVIAIAARFVYLSAMRGRLGAAAGGGQGVDSRIADWWTAAQRAAGEHRYTDAAHALYAALLASLERRERLKLHPAKTAGDYARELRRRSSPTHTPFREFARVFDYVIYGVGVCDRDRYERLREIAAPLIEGSAT